MDSDKKYCYINHVPLDEDVHRRVIDQATLVGLRPADFAAYLIGEQMKLEWKEPSPDEPEKYIDWKLMQMKRQEHMREQVFRAAALYKKNPSDENADHLSQMCDAASMAYNEVMKYIDNDPFSSLYLYAKNGSTLGSCMRWLSTFISERSGVVPAKIVKIAAARENYSDSTLERAKRTINGDMDSPMIVSEKRKEGWVWRIQGHAPSTEQDAEQDEIRLVA